MLRFTNTSLRILNKCMSTKSRLMDVIVDPEGIALLSFRREPVNSFSLDFMQEFSESLDIVDKDGSKGLIITSALPKIFSAGIDLYEFYKPDPVRVSLFWKTLHDVALKLYGSSYTTTVAIKGHAFAGACIISAMCDYRVMVNDHSRIGFNDTIVGIIPRPWVCEVMNRTMGYRQAEIAIVSSNMYSPDEALRMNLIDEMVNDKSVAIESCKDFIRKFDDIPLTIRGQTKRRLRETTLSFIRDHGEEDIKIITENVLKPDTQETIEKYINKLKLNTLNKSKE